jgi:hypothetical protein
MQVTELTADSYYDEGETVIDSRVFPLINGVASVQLQIPRDKKRNFRVLCNVVDQTGREIEDTAFFTYIPGDAEISLKLDKTWLLFGRSVTGAIEVNKVLPNARLDKQLQLDVYYDYTLDSTTVIMLPANGTIPFVFEPKKPGYYRFRLTDLSYPDYSIERQVFLYASNYSYRTGKELEVFTDAEQIKPGSRITFNLVSSFPQLSVIAIVDDGNQSSIKEVKLTNGNGSFTYLLSDRVNSDNLRCRFVSFCASKWISKNLSVPVDLSYRKVEILFNKPETVKPGETVDLSIEMRDQEHKPVYGAITLGILDQAVLDLYGSDDWASLLSTLTSPPLSYSFFYLNDSYSFYRLQDKPTTGYLYEGAGTLAQTKQAAANRSVKVRTKFSDTAFWKPLWVFTGSATTSVTFPEDLTTWCIRAIGFTKSGLSGYAKTSVVSTLPVTVTPVFPKFLRSGDQTRLGILVGNSLDDDYEFTVTLNATESSEIISFKQKESIRSKGSRIFWFDITIPAVKEEKTVSFALKAECDEAADAMVFQIPIKPENVRIPIGQSGILGPDTQSLFFDSKTDTYLTLTLSANIADELADAIRYLIDYPYGCVEQTVSSFLPAIVARTLIQEHPESFKEEAFGNLPDIIRTGVQRLYGLQNNEGGWGWWANGNTDAFMTSYALYAFYLIQEAGYEVNQDVISYGLRALKNVVGKPSQYEGFSYYVIKLFDPSYPLLLTSTELVDTKLFLALSFAKTGDISSAKTLLSEILEKGIRNAPLFYVRFEKDSYFLNSFQKNALLLILMQETGYEGAERNALVYYLFKNRSGHYWYSTKETSFAVMALANSELLSDNYTVEMRGNLDTFLTEKTNYQTMIEKNKSLVFPIVLESGEKLEVQLNGTQGILWKLTGYETWPLDQYHTETPKETFSRKLEKLFTISSLSLDSKKRIENEQYELYLPWDIAIIPAIIAKKDTPVDIAPVSINTFELVYTYSEYDYIDFYKLFVNSIDTGLLLSDEERVIGLYPDHLILSRNPWTGEDGAFSLYFSINEPGLKIGDKIRHHLTLNSDTPLNYSVIEDTIPPAFIQEESQYDYYGGKYTGYRRNWVWYEHKENRYDMTSTFYDSLPEGFITESYGYTLTTVGQFRVPPAKIYEMYDPTRIFSTDPYILTVTE